MNDDGARFDSGSGGGTHFSVSPEPDAVSLESALRDFGPAAIDDLIPRLRALAAMLDGAHRAGVVHGALHPSRIFVTDEGTSLIRGGQPVAPYAAPETTADSAAGPRTDQFALAAIAYEWLFGRPISGPADRAVDVRAMPQVDRGALVKAFSRALSRDPKARFASCGEFVDAIAAAVVPELPLLALDVDDEVDDTVKSFAPEAPAPAPDPVIAPVRLNPDAADEFKIDVSEGADPVDAPLHDARVIEPLSVPDPPAASRPSEPTNSSAVRPTDLDRRFGATALIIATLVGAVFGFAAGYMARPRGLQGGPAAEIRVAPDQRAQGATDAPASRGEAPAAPQTPAPAPAPAPAPVTPPARQPQAVGRLLVRSTPSGASVSVEGVVKGVTPLALRDLGVGTTTITVALRGYVSETRRIQISAARPSRTVDVRLTPETASAPRGAAPAAAAKPRSAVTAGSVVLESRPAGAAVTIDGRDAGTTPVTINDLSPGEYRIVFAMPGYRNFVTTVRVVAGERTRAAASLTAVEQE